MAGKKVTLVHTLLAKSRRERERVLWWRTLQMQSPRYLVGEGEGRAPGAGPSLGVNEGVGFSAPLLCSVPLSTSLSLATGLHGRDLRAVVVQLLDPKGISTAPTRGPKAPREQVLRVNQPHQPETPCSRQHPNQKPRSWDPNGFPHPSIQPCIHPSMHAYMRACVPYKSVDRSAESSLPSYGLRTGAPFAGLLPPAQPRPPPRGENSSITKGAKKQIPGLKRPAHRSFSGPLSVARSPPPRSPAQGRSGTRQC